MIPYMYESANFDLNIELSIEDLRNTAACDSSSSHRNQWVQECRMDLEVNYWDTPTRFQNLFTVRTVLVHVMVTHVISVELSALILQEAKQSSHTFANLQRMPIGELWFAARPITLCMH